MELLIKGYDNLTKYLKKKDIQKYYARTLISVFIFLIIPMVLLAIYNVPNLGDDTDHTFYSHLAWMNDHSFRGFWNVLVASWNNMVDMYFGMNGNYISFFSAAFRPIIFSEKLAILETTILLISLSVGEYLFLKEMILKQFKLSKNTLWIIYAGMMIMNTQFITSPRQAFYWWSGCVTNTMGFSAILVLLSILVSVCRTKKLTNKRCVVGVFLAFFIAGCNYSELIAFWVLLFFFGLTVFADSNIQRIDKIKIAIILTVLMIGTIVSVCAPGNSVRQSYNNESSFVAAIVNAILTGRQVVFSYMDEKVILLTLLFVPFVWNELDEQKEHRLPLLFLFLSCGILCAALTPTMKADSNYGPRRTRNVYFWIFLNLYVVNIIYFLGWLKSKLLKSSNRRSLVFEPKHQIAILVATILFGLCTIQLDDVKKMPFTQATLDLVSGRAQEFGREMNERYKLYYSDEKDITVDYIPYIPQLFVEENNPIYANEPGTSLPGPYYMKDSITVREAKK